MSKNKLLFTGFPVIMINAKVLPFVLVKLSGNLVGYTNM